HSGVPFRVVGKQLLSDLDVQFGQIPPGEGQALEPGEGVGADVHTAGGLDLQQLAVQGAQDEGERAGRAADRGLRAEVRLEEVAARLIQLLVGGHGAHSDDREVMEEAGELADPTRHRKESRAVFLPALVEKAPGVAGGKNGVEMPASRL